MFSGTVETPRPFPPAKARRATAALQKLSSTPPPAYGSPFTFPSRNVSLHGQGHDYEGEHPNIDLAHLPSPPPEGEEDWMSEKSREELKGLLVRADGIIRERENELGIASAVAKGLYQSNVVLKSKHQQLFARLPLSPRPSSSSPELPHTATFDSHSRANSVSVISSSTSDSALGLIKSPHLHYGQTRKVAIATADISLLADQNAELLDKLEKLEAEATSADHAGRRELKRLEKEIAFLREALEKTQAKSEALEEKVQDAVVGDIWRRKKEREAKFKAMRGLGSERVTQQEDQEEESALGVRNFAPTGSRFGGPSDKFSFFPSDLAMGSSSSDGDLNVLASVAPAPIQQPDPNSLISQLLVKVKELEETNTRIIQQQSETATQLSAVQRDTAHITKVYETLADPDAVELAFDQDEQEVGQQQEKLKRKESKNALTSSSNLRKSMSRSTMRFMSLKRSIENELAFDQGSARDAPGTFVVHPDFMSSASKNRKSVMGLFDNVDPTHAQEIEEHRREEKDDGAQEENVILPSDSSSSWSEGAGYSHSFWSSSSGELEGRSRSPATASGTLSPLHFFSPALSHRHLPPHANTHSASSSLDLHHHLDLPSTLPTGRPTLQAELNMMSSSKGGNDGADTATTTTTSTSFNHHFRTSSLYDLSQISVPPTPSPVSRTTTGGSGRMLLDELELGSTVAVAANKAEDTQLHPPPNGRGDLMNANSLKLSVEPPTPHKHGREERTAVAVPAYAYARLDSESPAALAEAAKSPRLKLISDTLKSRTNRWVERRLNRSKSRSRERDDERKSRKGRGVLVESDDEKEEVLQEGEKRPSAMRGRLSNAVDNLIEGFNGFSSKALGKVRSRSKSSKASSQSRSRSREGENLARDTESIERAYTPPLSSSPPSSASSEAGENYVHQRPNHKRQTSAPLLIYTDSPSSKEVATTNGGGSQAVKNTENGNPGLLLQVWMWLQFAIVVLVFVYAMAKRGPGSVLAAGGAEEGGAGRRAVARRRG